MENGQQSLSAVVQDILRNLQEIMRAEVRLAKAEVGEELAKAKLALAWVAAGAVGGLLGLWFLLFAAFSALAEVMPDWAAAGIVGGALLLLALMMSLIGFRRVKGLRPMPERTVETLKESVTWAKQSSS